MPELIKPTHKPIKAYYETLAVLGKQKIKHEQGLRGAFQALLTGLGNRSAFEWVIDQYQVSTDKRSGITQDPNRDRDGDGDDNPEYVVRLFGQVVRVSIETVNLVNAFPDFPLICPITRLMTKDYAILSRPKP